MTDGRCDCCSRLKDLELKVAALSIELRTWKETSFQSEGKRAAFEASQGLLGDTLLLDITESEKTHSSVTGIGEKLQQMNARLGELEVKCSILPNLKHNISKQTAVIHYLDRMTYELQQSIFPADKTIQIQTCKRTPFSELASSVPLSPRHSPHHHIDT